MAQPSRGQPTCSPPSCHSSTDAERPGQHRGGMCAHRERPSWPLLRSAIDPVSRGIITRRRGPERAGHVGVPGVCSQRRDRFSSSQRETTALRYPRFRRRTRLGGDPVEGPQCAELEYEPVLVLIDSCSRARRSESRGRAGPAIAPERLRHCCAVRARHPHLDDCGRDARSRQPVRRHVRSVPHRAQEEASRCRRRARNWPSRNPAIGRAGPTRRSKRGCGAARRPSRVEARVRADARGSAERRVTRPRRRAGRRVRARRGWRRSGGGRGRRWSRRCGR